MKRLRLTVSREGIEKHRKLFRLAELANPDYKPEDARECELVIEDCILHLRASLDSYIRQLIEKEKGEI